MLGSRYQVQFQLQPRKPERPISEPCLPRVRAGQCWILCQSQKNKHATDILTLIRLDRHTHQKPCISKHSVAKAQITRAFSKSQCLEDDDKEPWKLGEHGSKMSQISMLTIELCSKKYHRLQIGQSPLVDIENHCEPVISSQSGEFNDDVDEKFSPLPTKAYKCTDMRRASLTFKGRSNQI